jgi:hypothetical protein
VFIDPAFGRPRGIAFSALAALALVGALTATPATAAVGDDLTATISATEITLTWPDVEGAEAYLVVDERSGEVLWRGTANRYPTPLVGPTSRALLVFADLGNAAEFLGKALTMAPDSSSALPAAAAVSTRTGTDLVWTSVPGVDSWTVSTGGTDLVSTTTTSVSIPLTAGEREETVELGGLTLVGGEATRLASGFVLSEPQFTAADVGAESAEGDVVAASVPVIQSTRFSYEAYIPDQYVNAPDTGSPFDCESGDGSDYWYTGDNRSFAFDSGQYRTQAVADYYWYPAVTGTQKHVSPTNRYKQTSNGKVYDSTRTASSAGLVINAVSNNGRDALTQINHSIGNPYCSAMNNIDYDVREEVHSNGGYYVLGRHDRMPNHQLVQFDNMNDGSKVSRLIFHHELTDPKCLNWIYPCAQWQYEYTR